MGIFWGTLSTGWQKCIGCLKLQVAFRTRVADYTALLPYDYRALLRKETCKDKASYVSSPPCSKLTCDNSNVSSILTLLQKITLELTCSNVSSLPTLLQKITLELTCSNFSSLPTLHQKITLKLTCSKVSSLPTLLQKTTLELTCSNVSSLPTLLQKITTALTCSNVSSLLHAV